jgi:DNA gyrase/topoisomerase IV subunit B
VATLTIRRDGKKHSMEFCRGHAVDRVIEVRDGVEVSPLKVLGPSEKRGTEVHFLADEEIFEHIEFHYEILAKRLRELSFLNNGVRIRLIDQRTGKEEDFAFSGGVRSFVEYINRSPRPFFTRQFLLRLVKPRLGIPVSPLVLKSPCSGMTPIRNRCCASPTIFLNPMVEPI